MRATLAAVLVVVGIAGPAAAQTRGDVVRAVLHRTRRGVSIGPLVGGALVAGDSADFAVSFGVALWKHKGELPGAGLLRERIVRAIVDPDHAFDGLEADLTAEGLVREIAASGAGRWPKPSFELGLEGTYLARADGWQLRLSAGLGVWHLSVGGATTYTRAGGEGVVLAGLEVATYALLGSGPRPSALQLFVRADFATYDRDAFADVYGLGARLMLDLL